MSSRIIKTLLALALMAGGGTASAATFVTWATPISGSANSVTVSVNYTTGSPSLGNFDLSGADYSPAGGATQQIVNYNMDAGITWTFSSAVTNLDLYLTFWRGAGSFGPSDSTYLFSAAPTIQSGLSGGSISGNSFVGSSSGYYNGILRFSGPLTSLTLTAPNVGGSSGQAYTLAFDVASSAVPDGASTFGLLGAAVGALGLATRRRLRS